MKNLATFKMVYETRSFSKAAELLFIAQPTVSAQIHSLEAEFHTTLFIRNGRGALGLTDAADTLYEQACNVLATWESLHVRLGAGLAQQQVKIAASHTFAMYWLPQLLPQLYANFPQVRFSVVMANSLQVQAAITNHDADLGFIEKPLAKRGLARTTLMADQLVQVGDSGPWLVREDDSGVAYYTKRYLAEQNAQAPRIEIAANAVIVQLLAAGFGRSIISERAAAGMAVTPLGPDYRRHFYLVTREHDAMVATCRQAVVTWAKQSDTCGS